MKRAPKEFWLTLPPHVPIERVTDVAGAHTKLEYALKVAHTDARHGKACAVYRVTREAVVSG